MIIVKSFLSVLTIALVVQGLFFSVDGAEDLKVKASFAVEEKSCLEQARRYAERGLIDLAIPELQKMTELYPDDIEARAYLGWVYSQKGLISDAVWEFQKVLEMNPELQKVPFDYPMAKGLPATVKEFTVSFEEVIDVISEFPVAYEVLGLCYVLQGRLGDALNEYKKVLALESCFVRKGFIANGKKAISPIDQAIREYEDVLWAKPDCVEAYLKLACAHAEKGTLDAAIENMKKVISVEPDQLEAHVYLGCFYAKKWMLDEAIKELGEAKQLRDRIIEKLVTEAERFIRDCKFDKAIAVAREIIKIDSRNKKAHWLLAMAYGKKGEMDEAVNVCKEIMGLYPDDIHAYTLLGWIYAQRDLFKEAMDAAGQAVRIAPENADIRALMAFLSASQNQIHEAVATCNVVNNKASGGNVPADYGWVKGNVASIEQKLREVIDVLKMKPDYTEAYLCLGWLHSKNGDIEKAIPAFRKAIELMPDSHDAYLYLGNLYVQKGEIQDALDEYNKACEILSKKAQDAMAQGLASIKKGDIGRAIDCFNEALRVEPESQEAYAFLADAYEKKGLYSVGMVLRLQGERLKREAHNY
ncbi:MAG: tetratricopeptide repeat protein [Planctomycetes bacterium]|uniref:tetratricopeptide repeat protein n=1 Tax=Candidatus Wunengus sp. YC65 TaxID=3367701 RepID=UPI001D7C078B|nr:tetratricopeptide repeat protein [Planctomycetota bacterium]